MGSRSALRRAKRHESTRGRVRRRGAVRAGGAGGAVGAKRVGGKCSGDED